MYLSGNIGYPYTYSSNEWTLGWFSVEGKYLIGDAEAVRYFFLGEVGLGVLAGTGDNGISGLAVGGGGGIEYFFAEQWSVNGAGLIRYSHFTRAVLNGKSGGLQDPLGEAAITLNGGVTFHF